jgi:hypothetical protein
MAMPVNSARSGESDPYAPKMKKRLRLAGMSLVRAAPSMAPETRPKRTPRLSEGDQTLICPRQHSIVLRDQDVIGQVEKVLDVELIKLMCRSARGLSRL